MFVTVDQDKVQCIYQEKIKKKVGKKNKKVGKKIEKKKVEKSENKKKKVEKKRVKKSKN